MIINDKLFIEGYRGIKYSQRYYFNNKTFDFKIAYVGLTTYLGKTYRDSDAFGGYMTMEFEVSHDDEYDDIVEIESTVKNNVYLHTFPIRKKEEINTYYEIEDCDTYYDDYFDDGLY